VLFRSWAGGAKITPIKRQMERDPRKVVYLAVKRMIRNNRLRGKQMTRLRIFTGPKAAGIPQPPKVSK
jgi:ribosomal protein L13